MISHLEQKFLKRKEEWKSNITLFMQEVFPEARIYQHQLEILTALAKYKKVSVRSGHGIGKDAVATIAIWWFLICFDHPKVPCTASTASQLESVLWGELRKWHSRMGMPGWLAKQYELLDREVRHVDDKDWRAWAITTRKGDEQSAAGIHEENVLLILDEASEITDKVIETLMGSLSGANVYVLAIGNPITYQGFFYRTFHELSQMFFPMHYDGEEISKKHPELVSPELIAYFETYGRDSDVFGYRVKGEFPKKGARQLIAIDKLHQSYERVVAKTGELTIIVDVARFGGDKSVIAVMDGRHLDIYSKFEKTDIPETAARVSRAIEDLQETRVVTKILIDEPGVGGGVVDILRRRYSSIIEVVGFIGQATSIEIGSKKFPILLADGTPLASRFTNLRSCAYWMLGIAVEKGQVRLPKDRDLENQLLNIPYLYANGDRIQIPSKQDLRKGITIEDRLYKLPRSPDEADVMAMALSPLARIVDYGEEAFEDPYGDEEDDPDFGLDVNGQPFDRSSYVGLLG